MDTTQPDAPIESSPNLHRQCPAEVRQLFERHPEIDRVRIDVVRRSVELAFLRQAPARETLAGIASELSGAFAGVAPLRAPRGASGADWHVTFAESAEFHHHHLGDGAIEFHRAHCRSEPWMVWRRIHLPIWEVREAKTEPEHDWRLMLAFAAACGICTLAAFILAKHGGSMALIAPLLTIAYFCGGWFAAEEVTDTLRRGHVDVHFLMLFVAVGALFVNAAVEGATLLFLFSLSGALEAFADHRTRKTISSLLKAAPKKALRRAGDRWDEVAIEAVEPGNELLVKPGELFPVDGEVIEGTTSADESALTGESLPVAKKAGDEVCGGTLNLDGRAIVRVTRLPEQSALQRIIALIETAQQQKAPSQRFTEMLGRRYTWAVLILSVIAFIVLMVVGKPFSEALYRTMTLLVVASPCALVLSIPSAILVAIAAGARRGILFRGGLAIENLAAVDQFAFDKTGTLTKGALRVSRLEALDSRPAEEMLRIAAAVARSSTHPLARAIVREAEERAFAGTDAKDFRNIPGFGMEGRLDGETIVVGNRKLMSERGFPVPAHDGSRGEAEVWIAGAQLLGTIYLSDELRSQSPPVIAGLKRDGSGVALVTGDHAAAAQAIASQTGIEEVHAELTPEAKLNLIHGWQKAGRRVAMIGDGINDAPSLTAADVAIAMGARGSDAALEQADVVLMNDRIENLTTAVALSRGARAVIRQNLIFSIAVIVILIVSALAQKINLTLGVIGHEGSTVVVILNGLRLLRFAAQPAGPA